MGGSSKKQTTQRYEPWGPVKGASFRALNLGQKIASQEYSPYEGERVAGLSPNERRGISLARESEGVYKPYYARAGALAERGTGQWDEDTAQRYMNPYIKGALDPAAREIKEYGALQMRGVEDQAASMDAWGRRSHIAKADIEEKTLQNLSDLYGQGYAAAYESAASMWGSERARDLEAAGRFQMLGEGVQDAAAQDVSTLFASGAVDRNIRQAMADFDYQQWTEERNWDMRSLSGLLAAIQGTRGATPTTTTSVTEDKKDPTGDIMGAVIQLVGMYMMSGSDERLKENITYLFTHMGHKIYTWTWKPIAIALGIAGPPFGVIAQEHPEATVVGPQGFLLVDYPKLFGGES